MNFPSPPNFSIFRWLLLVLCWDWKVVTIAPFKSSSNPDYETVERITRREANWLRPQQQQQLSKHLYSCLPWRNVLCSSVSSFNIDTPNFFRVTFVVPWLGWAGLGLAGLEKSSFRPVSRPVGLSSRLQSSALSLFISKAKPLIKWFPPPPLPPSHHHSAYFVRQET
jgi:hypothetical protein